MVFKFVMVTFCLLQFCYMIKVSTHTILRLKLTFPAERNLKSISILYSYDDLHIIMRYHKNSYTVKSKLRCSGIKSV